MTQEEHEGVEVGPRVGDGSAGPHRATLQVAPHSEERGGLPRERNDEGRARVCSKEKDADVADIVGSGMQCPCRMGQDAH